MVFKFLPGCATLSWMLALNWQSFTLPQSFNFNSDATVLDVGSGSGEQLSEASGRFKIALEPDFSSLRNCKARGLPSLRGCAEQIPLSTDSVDGVICKVVLCLTKEDQAVKEISRVLKPHGRAYLIVNGSGYYLRYLLFSPNIKHRIYGLRALLNTWLWTLTGKSLPGFFGDTIYQSKLRLNQYFIAYNLTAVSIRASRFIAWPVFIYTEVIKSP